eukprot:scaffold16.g49.t1
MPLQSLLLLLALCAHLGAAAGPAATAQVLGNVVIPAGVPPPPDVEVLLTLDTGALLSAPVAADGRFELADVPVGTHLLDVVALGLLYPSIKLAVSSSSVIAHAADVPGTPPMAYPLLLQPIARQEYYEKRQTFNLIAFLKTPYGMMIAFMCFSIYVRKEGFVGGGVGVMPKLKIDPEEYKDILEGLAMRARSVSCWLLLLLAVEWRHACAQSVDVSYTAGGGSTSGSAAVNPADISYTGGGAPSLPTATPAAPTAASATPTVPPVATSAVPAVATPTKPTVVSGNIKAAVQAASTAAAQQQASAAAAAAQAAPAAQVAVSLRTIADAANAGVPDGQNGVVVFARSLYPVSSAQVEPIVTKLKQAASSGTLVTLMTNHNVPGPPTGVRVLFAGMGDYVWPDGSAPTYAYNSTSSSSSGGGGSGGSSTGLIIAISVAVGALRYKLEQERRAKRMKSLGVKPSPRGGAWSADAPPQSKVDALRSMIPGLGGNRLARAAADADAQAAAAAAAAAAAPPPPATPPPPPAAAGGRDSPSGSAMSAASVATAPDAPMLGGSPEASAPVAPALDGRSRGRGGWASRKESSDGGGKSSIFGRWRS